MTKKKRPIPPIDPKNYAQEGVVTIRPWVDGQSVKIEVHHCSIYVLEKEAFELLLSLLTACVKVWGNLFMRKFLVYVEHI